MKNLFLLLIFSALTFTALAQEPRSISIKVMSTQDSSDVSGFLVIQGSKNYNSNEALQLLPGATTIFKDGFEAYYFVLSDADFDKGNRTLYIKPSQLALDAVVISAARRETQLRKAPISIYSKSHKELMTSPSHDIYYTLATSPETDIVQLGGNVKVINTRGFNDPFQNRFVQLVNGVDVQLPALNATLGNVTGPIQADVKRAELIAGPSSAMFGANAFQGLSNLITYNPLDDQNLEIQLKGGSRDYMDLQGVLNIANKKKNLGVKVGGAYNTMMDWEATDPNTNVYGKIGQPVNLSGALQGYLNSAIYPGQDSAFNQMAQTYFDSTPGALPGTHTITAPGVAEADAVDYRTISAKAVAGIFYRPTDKMEVSYTYNYSYGRQMLQGTTRYFFNVRSHIHDFNVSYDRLKLKVNYNQDDVYDSYNMLLAGNYMSISNFPLYVGALTQDYYESVYLASNGFTDALSAAEFEELFANSQVAAESAWWSADSDTFNNRLNEITTNTNSLLGAGLVDKSSIFHAEASYNLPVEVVKVDLLAYYRSSNPVSYGTLFEDTLVNAADAPADGSLDKNLDYVDLAAKEYGGLVQANKSLLDGKLDIWASARVDGHSNFKTQISPRGGLVANLGKHSIRAAYQYGFRNPTLQNQYIKLDLGRLLLLGNINGYTSLIGLSDFQAFAAEYAMGNVDTTLIPRTNIDPLVQEQVSSIEFGYRGEVKSFSIEANFFYNWYKNFIGSYRAMLVPNADNLSLLQMVGEITSTPSTARVIQIPVNFEDVVNTYGGSLKLTYRYTYKMLLSANYSYSGINVPATSTYLPGFNTPKHKVNFLAQGNRLYKGLGASAHARWADFTEWRSSIGDGVLPAYWNLDVAVHYDFDEPSTRVSLGCTNITDNQIRYAVGAPAIGRMVYASLVMDIDLKKKN